ncbi:(p)ppGpp synthetase, partial [Clostridium perfringens]|nr:(p)ppGpp synthetase [Clostridium perfringens]
ILRNSYYKKYKNSEEFISNLSDLVGVRIECRFIEDEKTIHKMLKKHFNIKGLKGYFYNDDNANIRLELESKQPQKQKNGFGIYRIDGLYQHNNRSIKFELQIKSLVNIFWGEIEHKVIYK